MAYSSIILGTIAAMFFGMSKTGIPGISIPAVLMMTLAFPGEEKLSAGAVVPLLIIGDCFAVWHYHSSADWSQIRKLLPSIFLGLFIGTGFLLVIDDKFFKMFLGIMVLVLIGFEELRRWRNWNTFPRSKVFAWTMGLLAGFTTQIGNAAGPVMGVYLATQDMKKPNFMGTWAVFFFIVNISKLPLIGGLVPGLQMITAKTLWFDLMVLPGVIIGAILGRYLYKLVPERYFVRVIMLFNLIVPIQLILFR